MNRIKFCGGYGEHGRSCFLIEYGTEGRCYLLDCGIMDSDSNPNPHITKEEIERVDYLFLSHCHKDHSGAVSWLVNQGFCGTLVTTDMTLKLTGIAYDSVRILPADQTEMALSELFVQYGRTGHCPGSLWFRIVDGKRTVFYSGDYQKRPYLYTCDVVEGMDADVAIIDQAHIQSDLQADELREILWKEIESALLEDKTVILPVPKFGRGPEMAAMLMDRLAVMNQQRAADQPIKLCVDQEFVNCTKKMTAEGFWFQQSIQGKTKRLYHKVFDPASEKLLTGASGSGGKILMIADTHLVMPQNADFVRSAADQGAAVIITGRVKKGSACERLLMEEKAKRFLYPHHQSRADFEEMIGDNRFDAVIPFHNGMLELWKFQG